METLLIAKFFAIALLSTGLAVVLKPEELKKSIDAMLKNQGITFLAGIFTLYLGAFLVTFHHSWNTPWEIIISAIGYLVVLKGFLYLAFPGEMKKMTDVVFKDLKHIRLIGLLVIVLALALLYKAVWCGCLG